MHTLINKLRNRWNELTGQDIKERPFERIGYEFLKDFTVEEMEVVIQFMLHQNSRREPRFRDVLRFDRVLGDIETFEARRGEAAAWFRNRKQPTSAKQSVLNAFRATTPALDGSDTSRTIKDVLRTIQ